MTDIKALVDDLEALLAAEPVFVVGHPIRRAISSLRDLTAWLTMESAPKDGKCIVWCATDDGGEARVLDRNGNGDWLYEGEPTYCAGFYIEPVAWLPLPSAPDLKETGE